MQIYIRLVCIRGPLAYDNTAELQGTGQGGASFDIELHKYSSCSLLLIFFLPSTNIERMLPNKMVFTNVLRIRIRQIPNSYSIFQKVMKKVFPVLR